jgi:Flp pilus assembly protein TadD
MDAAPRRRLAALLAAALLALPACARIDAARQYRDGRAALARGEPERAIAHLEAARRQAPGRADVRDQLGVAYARAGRLDDAIAELERAVALDCTNAQAARHLDIARAARDREIRTAPPAGP